MLRVYGLVQGIGFRPFVRRLAQQHQLVGWVQNTHDGVRIEVQGEPAALDGFLKVLRQYPPPLARIDHIDIGEVTNGVLPGTERFTIRDSIIGRPPYPMIPADIATCSECLAEIRSPTARRYRYPFTSCSQCGPRYSIIERLPYDRPRTSMRTFKLCTECEVEYADPNDRRYHAQPIACPACGPQLQLLTTTGDILAARDDALVQACEALREGRIVAIKGLGGFQLCADATDPKAVKELRRRKRRPDKPFAIMCDSIQSVRQYCEFSEHEGDALISLAAPIVLLRKSSGAALAREIALDNPYLAVMLPYTPLHHLILESLQQPMVCTSGNLSEEPMCIETHEALNRLGGIADVLLTHDRPIVRAVDDSVVRVSERHVRVLRRARGYTPMPLTRPRDGPCVLAFGGHLKNTVALATEKHVNVSQHIGDLGTLQGINASERAVNDMLAFYKSVPSVVACDLHPDYASTRLARDFASKHSLPVQPVQHHHAHVCACMAEHRLSGPVLGLAWDGTGYGPDDTVWGGEALICTYEDFTRAAHLRPFRLPGGEQAIRDPRRAALGMVYEVYGQGLPPWVSELFSDSELNMLCRMLDKEVNAPRSTSMGRLFDAAAVLAGIQTRASFDGHAAMAVEFAAERAVEIIGSDTYPLPLSTSEPAVADWGPMLRAIVEEREQGTPADIIAARFHNSLAALAEHIAQRVRLQEVVLSGGCFQNALLSTRVSARLRRTGFQVHTHRSVPPNDGGIAVGQALVAASRVNSHAGV